MKPFVHWSPSQVDTFELCNRKWWFNKIMGLEIPQHPSATLGQATHAELETYLEHGDPKVLGPIARAGLDFLPQPGTVLIEYDIAPLALTAAGLPALGRIDCLSLSTEPPEVIDHKTIGNLDYAKTSDDLARNVQMTVYARAATRELESMGLPAPKAVKVSHIAYQTKGAHRAQKTSALLTQERIAQNWQRIDATVKEMRETSTVLTPDRVTPTKSACDAYGGCFFRDRCRALNATSSIAKTLPTKTGDTMPDPKANPLLARLGVKTKAAAEAPEETAPAAPAPASDPAPAVGSGKASVLARLRKAAENPPVSTSIVPPDAPTDEETAAAIAAEETAAAEAAAEKAKPKEVKPPTPAKADAETDTTRRPRNALPRLMALGYLSDDVAGMDNATMHAILDAKVRKGETFTATPPAEASEPSAAPTPTPVAPSPSALPVEAPAAVSVAVPAPVVPVASEGLTLYIDCRPVKGTAQPTDLTDLLAPLMRAVASDAGVDHYTMVPYGQGPARVAALVARDPWTTGVLFVDSRAPASQAVLEVLRPYATTVVQGR
jgi:hypothetical protein